MTGQLDQDIRENAPVFGPCRTPTAVREFIGERPIYHSRYEARSPCCVLTGHQNLVRYQ